MVLCRTSASQLDTIPMEKKGQDYKAFAGVSVKQAAAHWQFSESLYSPAGYCDIFPVLGLIVCL